MFLKLLKLDSFEYVCFKVIIFFRISKLVFCQFVGGEVEGRGIVLFILFYIVKEFCCFKFVIVYLRKNDIQEDRYKFFKKFYVINFQFEISFKKVCVLVNVYLFLI